MNPTPRGFPTNPLIPSHRTPPPPPAAQMPAPYVPGELTKKFLSESPAAAPPGNGTPTDLAGEFRHAGWMPFRRRVEQALRTTEGITPRRLSAFCNCGSDAFVEGRGRVVNCGTSTGPSIFGQELRVRATKCHDRFCVPCSQERSNRIRFSLLKHMFEKKNLKLITLTLAASDEPLTKILDRITRCFRLLRNKPFWKKAVQGGTAIVETKIGKNSGSWHVHFHIVAETNFIKQAQLSEEWLAITGDSRIVDIRAVGAKTGAVSYITKYITKAADHSIVMDPERLREAIIAFTGRRLVTTFGTWRGLQLMEKTTDDDDYYFDDRDQCRYPKPEWRPLGPLHEIIKAAAAGDPGSAFILSRLKKRPARASPDLRQLPEV